jgi:hypothetical protein
MKVKTVVRLFCAVTLWLCAYAASAAVYDFQITYNGSTQTVDAGSSPILGTNLLPGDHFLLNIHAAGNDFWESQTPAKWSFGIFASFSVSSAGVRVGDVTTSLLFDHMLVAQQTELSQAQSSVHIGVNNSPGLTPGLRFDEIVVDYDFLSSTASATEIITNTVHYNNFDEPMILYRIGPTALPPEPTATAPEPSSVALLGVAIAAFVLRRRRTES